MFCIKASMDENISKEDIHGEHNLDNDNNNVNNESSNDRDDRIGIINTVLVYLQYGISSATVDNVLEVACTHFTFDEIIDAKDKLWKECCPDEPAPVRNNSKGRRALEAHTRDIIEVIYKLDKENYTFFMESGGIARLPRFNAECLNVVALDQRIADLNEQCFANKQQASAYRNDYLQCRQELNLVQTVLQQHTDALRNLRNNDGSFGSNLFKSPSTAEPSYSAVISSGVTQKTRKKSSTQSSVN